MEKAKRLETILVLVLALVVVYWYKRYDWLLKIAIGMGLVSLLVPAVATGIHWCWTKLSHALGVVSGTLLLGIVYIVVLLPLSFLSRLFGKGRGIKPGSATYFKERNHSYTREDMMNPW